MNQNETSLAQTQNYCSEFFTKIDEKKTTEIMTKFQDDILFNAKEIETYILASHKTLKEDFDLKAESYEKKIDLLTTKLDEISNCLAIDKVKLERVNDLQIFQKKANDQLISHEVKINSMQKDLSNACYKYDKLYLDNLVIPGTIGDYCKFKNMKEYIEHNITQVQNLLNFKDKHILDLKLYKEKLDGMLKTMGMQLENSDKNAKSYTNKIIQEYENILKSDISDVAAKICDLRMENNKHALDLQKATNELVVDYGKIMNIKEDINRNLDEAVSNMKDSHKITVSDFDGVRSEFDRIRSRFTEISEFIKVKFCYYD